MARTAKVRLTVYDDGILLGDADSIDFTGAGVSGSYNPTTGRVTENIPGAGTTYTSVFSEIVSGSVTTFTLAHVPTGTVEVIINGQVGKLGDDYTIVGAVITTALSWSAGQVQASYQY